MIETIKQIAIEAGEIVMKYYKGEYEINSKSSDRFNPVTTADLESSAHIIERLEQEFPDMQVLSEENLDVEIDWSGKVWIIDPIDGTIPFTKHENFWAILIGLCDNGIPVMGVMYFPVLKEMYWAEKGKGAFCDGKKLKVNDIDRIEDAEGCIENKFRASLPFRELIKDVWCIAAIMRKMLNKEASAIICAGNSGGKWDLCATQIIIEEAGGQMTYLNGKEVNYKTNSPFIGRPVLVSNKALHDNILEALDRRD